MWKRGEKRYSGGDTYLETAVRRRRERNARRMDFI